MDSSFFQEIRFGNSSEEIETLEESIRDLDIIFQKSGEIAIRLINLFWNTSLTEINPLLDKINFQITKAEL